jgi:hypothetical protein
MEVAKIMGTEFLDQFVHRLKVDISDAEELLAVGVVFPLYSTSGQGVGIGTELFAPRALPVRSLPLTSRAWRPFRNEICSVLEWGKGLSACSGSRAALRSEHPLPRKPLRREL